MALKTLVNSLVVSRDVTDEYLTQLFGAPTDATTWTLSVWFKRARNLSLGQEDTIFSAGAGTFDFTRIMFDDFGRLQFEHFIGAGLTDDILTTATFRDPTAWYHLVVRYDSNEVVATDRVRFWVNNVQITDFTTSNFPTLAQVTDINTAQTHEVCRDAGSTGREFDGYLAEMVFCDGETLSPTDFAEQNGATWQPKAPSVTFGSNGFHLEFLTAGALGDDTSGNVNDFTETNIDATNQREDSPTQNHLTWNQSYFGLSSGVLTLENGSRELLCDSGGHVGAFASAPLPKTGKYYWEIDWAAGATATDRITMGVGNQLGALDGRIGDDNHSWGLYNPSGVSIRILHAQADLVTFTDTAAFAVGDYFMFAYDSDTGELWFGRNGTFFDSGDPGAGTGAHVTLTADEIYAGQLIPSGSILTAANRLDFRAGAEDFEGTIPTGFNTLDTSTWPEGPISDPSQYFDLVAYTGDGVNPRSLGGFYFQPDIVWVKSLNADPSSHLISDIIKGAGSIHVNESNSADDPAHTFGEIGAFDADGFTVDAVAGNDRDVNDAANTYMGFMWKEDPVAGLDLVGYAGTGVPQDISHSLGAAPEVMYVRNRDVSDDNNGYFEGLLDATGEPVTDPGTDFFDWNDVTTVQDNATKWDDTEPDASNFRVGTDGSTNSSGDNHAAFLWRGIEGFSKFSGYVGTGADDSESPFIYTGFRPKLVMTRRLVTNGLAEWRMFFPDNALSGSPGGTNSTQNFEIHEDSAVATPPGSGLMADFCASGYKLRQTAAETNADNIEYLAFAWAEVPFQFASARSFAPSPADGALDLNFEIDATGDDPNQFGDGALDIAILISATGTGGKPKGDGVLDLGIEINATGSVPVQRRGDGAIELKIGGSTNADATPQLGIDGVGRSIHTRGDGAIELKIGGITVADPNPQLGIDGVGFNTAIRGSPTLPQLTTTGQMESSVQMQGSAILPNIVMGAVTIDNANRLEGNFSLPVLTTLGEINPDFDVDLPIPEVNGTILSGATLRTSGGNAGDAIPLPQLVPSGTLFNPGVTDGNAVLPRLQVTGTLLAGAAITAPSVDVLGASTLPALTANGFLLIPSELAGTLTLPALDVSRDTILAPGAIVTGSVTLPLLRLESVLVNGVTLAATVWSMNTETLETTNYLNFDFDSLVSFADQPYGVTSAGIFLLEGDDDDGTDINARILTGISDRGDEALKEASHMYMQYTGQAMMFQLMPDGQQRLREYRFERRSNSSGVIHARAKGSRGLRSRSWQMGLRNLSGGAFTLDKFGLLLRILTRNTRKN